MVTGMMDGPAANSRKAESEAVQLLLHVVVPIGCPAGTVVKQTNKNVDKQWLNHIVSLKQLNK